MLVLFAYFFYLRNESVLSRQFGKVIRCFKAERARAVIYFFRRVNTLNIDSVLFVCYILMNVSIYLQFDNSDVEG